MVGWYQPTRHVTKRLNLILKIYLNFHLDHQQWKKPKRHHILSPLATSSSWLHYYFQSSCVQNAEWVFEGQNSLKRRRGRCSLTFWAKTLPHNARVRSVLVVDSLFSAAMQFISCINFLLVEINFVGFKLMTICRMHPIKRVPFTD